MADDTAAVIGSNTGPRQEHDEQAVSTVLVAPAIGQPIGQTRLDHVRREQAAADNDLPLSMEEPVHHNDIRV
ncbi:hypothetical protein NO113_19925, partial [Clostridioides difficile]|nr:hypothetical protein [Clostridioides difficile]